MSGKKIIVITSVKDEADIIESFVRYTLTFADEIIINIHNSTDNTVKILSLLQAEGLPLIFRYDYRWEFQQDEITNKLLKEAMAERGADLVIPLDADEFPISLKKGWSLRKIFETLDTGYIYFMHWLQFRLRGGETDPHKFILSQPALMSEKMDRLFKTFAGAKAWHADPFRISSGAHTAYRIIDGNYKQLGAHCVYDLLLAHYHWRGVKHHKRKIAVGWLLLASAHSVYTHFGTEYKPQFDSFVEEGDAYIEHSDESGGIDWHDENGAKIKWSDCDWSGEIADIPMRYGELGRIDLLNCVLRTAEGLAEGLAAERCRNLRRRVSAVVVDPLDLRGAAYADALRRTLNSLDIASAECPLSEIVVIRDGSLAAITDEIASSHEFQTFYGVLQFITPDELEKLQTAATGDYLVYFAAGVEAFHDCLIRAAMSIEFSKYKYISFINAIGSPPQDELGALYFKPRDSQLTIYDWFVNEPFWRSMLTNDEMIYGGFSGFFMRREFWEKRGAFKGAFDDGVFWDFAAWRLVCKNGFALGGMIPARFINAAGPKNEQVARSVRWQIYRIKCVVEELCREDEGKMADEDLRKFAALTEATIRQTTLNLLKLAEETGVDENLTGELKKMCAGLLT